MLADVIWHRKMPSFMALDGVTLFLCLKGVSNTRKRMGHSHNYWREFFSAKAERWKKLKTSNVFLSFFVCWNRNRSAPRDLPDLLYN